MAFVFLLFSLSFLDLRFGSLLLETLRQHNAFWQAKLVAQGSIILIPKLNANGKLLHSRSLNGLLSIMRHKSSKHPSNALLLISPSCFQLVLPILHLFVLLLKDSGELPPLVVVLLRLGNLSFGKPSARLDGQTFTVVVNLT